MIYKRAEWSAEPNLRLVAINIGYPACSAIEW